MRRPGLGGQLGLAFAAVAALTALLAGAIVALSWQSTFNTYVRSRVQSDANVLADAAGRSWAQTDSWRRASLADIALYGVNRGLRVQVINKDGSVVLDSFDLGVSIQMPGGLTPSVGEMMGQSSESPLNDPVVQAPVYVDGTLVGSVKVASSVPGGFLTERDVSFRDSSAAGLTVAGLLAVALASAGGVLYSRLFSRPIERVTMTAASLRGGSREARTGMSGEDPVGALGRTLDEMADAIEAEREFERRLTADVAHELRTPLQAIQATVEAMQDGVLPADPEHLGVVRDETVRLARLADSILDLSRLETRSARMRTEPLDLAVPLSRSVETHRALIESADLRLVEQLEEGLAIAGDVDRLTQAFGNLISNAVRYTPAGGTVTVALRAEPDRAVVTVSDTGIGIAEEERARAFARFWRSDAARERARSGFGIGLAVVREVIDQHGGTVTLEPNQPGPGTTATVTLPTLDRRASRQV